MKKLAIAIALLVVGLSALAFFSYTSSAKLALPQDVQVVIQNPQSRTVEPQASTPEATPEAVAAPEPWYVVIAASVKEIAAAMVALAGAIMALVEVLKKLKEKSPPAAG